MKRPLLILSFLIFCTAAFTQSWEELNAQLKALTAKGDLKGAIPVAEKAAAAAQKRFGELNASYAANLNYLALLYQVDNQYEKAEPLFIHASEIMKKTVGENHPSYVTSLINLAEIYEKMGQYQKAETYRIQIVDIQKKILGENNPDYVASLNKLGELYVDLGQYVKAEPLYIQAAEKRKKILGENDPEYATSLGNLASLYHHMGQYEKAESLYVISKEKRKKILGENHPNYANSLNNLGRLYEEMGQYEKAEPLYLEAAKIRRNALGEDDPLYINTMSNLAAMYLKKGQYDKAELIFIQVREKRKKIFGEDHPDYAISLNNLAFFYERTGLYERAEPLYLQATEIRKKRLGENHPDYAGSLDNLGVLYVAWGRYARAEILYMQAKEIRRKVFGENHPEYAISLSNLGSLYVDMGQYEKAADFLAQAKEIRKKILGENHPDYALSLNKLGSLYLVMGQYKEAEILYLQAKEINRKVLGENHPDYAASLNNLALLYIGLGQYTKAEPLLISYKEILGRTLGENHPYYAQSLNNLGGLYNAMGQYEKAEPFYLQAKEIRKRVLGENHPDYATSLINLALLYLDLGQYEKAEPLILTDAGIEVQNLKNTFGILSEKEKGNYLANNLRLVETNNSFIYNYRKASPTLIRTTFNLQLFLKSLSLSDTRSMLESVSNSQDNNIQKLFKEWQLNKSLLAKQYSLEVNMRMQKLDSIEAATEILEKELTRKSTEFGNQQVALQISMADAQKNLEQDEAIVEFVRFQLYNRKWTDSTIYAAYIVRKNDPVPKFISLCEEKQLQLLFDSAGKTATSMVNQFYRGIEIKNKNVATLGKELYELVWEPLEPFLKGIKKIAYSPAGKLYSVAFQALPVDSTTILIDKYKLQQYSSTRQVALRNTENQSIKPSGIILFGDANFSMDSLSISKQRTAQPGNTISASIYTPSTRSADNNSWPGLPGTAEEVKKIAALFDQNKIASKTFTKTNASEENLKALSGKSPQILHIATHGFFLPAPDKKKKENGLWEGNTYTLADDPLLRSGLILSGGNYAWSGKKPVEGVEDGIATAYEISQLNLSNTELVVLSACETALGDVKGSEGVFGLQRAFKMAGVKKMIVSLWQVPDKETAELMTTFYSYWMKGKNINESFYQAQADMRKKYTPFYWAAFVLVE